MTRIVIASVSDDARDQLSGLLSASGFSVYRTCASGSEVRRALHDCDDGILVQLSSLPDALTDDLQSDFGDHIRILFIARPPVLDACESPSVFRLPLPSSMQAIQGAVDMLSQMQRMEMPRRMKEEKELVDRAKRLLMEREELSEPQAHRAMQLYCMSHSMKMTDYARQLLGERRRQPL
ncbi:MAG: ANTAR domain-containing protein [Clostridia bacterium]|nr:ANTAR domain-containing protein [Clostridia bacterium]